MNFSPSSFRQGLPESSHRDVSIHRCEALPSVALDPGNPCRDDEPVEVV